MPAVGHRLDSLKARRIAAGMSIYELARRSTVSEWTITMLEEGGNCRQETSDKLLNALAPPVAITSNSQASPTVVTTAAAHSYVTGDTVVIAGVTGSNADVNGTRVVTFINGTTFSVPVNCGVAGGTGGTCTPSLTSLGIARL